MWFAQIESRKKKDVCSVNAVLALRATRTAGIGRTECGTPQDDTAAFRKNCIPPKMIPSPS